MKINLCRSSFLASVLVALVPLEALAWYTTATPSLSQNLRSSTLLGSPPSGSPSADSGLTPMSGFPPVPSITPSSRALSSGSAASQPSAGASQPSASASQPSATTNITSASSSLTNSTAPATATSIAIPSPFDSGFDYQLTPSCTSFFQKFLASQDFIKCYSFGFLMIDSLGFSLLARNINNVAPLLDEICAATTNETISTTCNNVMANYMAQMADTNNCGADLTATPANPEALQAYLSFVTYGVYQAAGCLKNSTGQYCYIDELLSKTNGLDLYLLPEGFPLPNTTMVGCSDCTQRIMITYSKYGGVANTPLNTLYSSTAKQIQAQCGSQFVPSDPVAVSAAVGERHRRRELWLSPAVALIGWVTVWQRTRVFA